MNPLAFLKVRTIGGIRVSDASRFLKIMIEAYHGLLTLDEIHRENLAHSSGETPIHPDIFYEEDELILSSIRVSSRGYCEFLGREKPLLGICQYLNNRYARNKQNEEKIEDEGTLIENSILNIDLVKEVIASCRKIECSETEVSHIVKEYALIPLLKLDNFQDIGVISKAELTKEGESELSALAEG